MLIDRYGRQQLTTKKGGEQSRCLEFVHITKTGGTAIEAIAAASGIRWGACHWHPELSTCNGVAKIADIPSRQTAQGGLYSDWHNPHMLEVYKCNNLFSVVRNPYTRMLSWFYCPWAGYKGDEIITPSVLNKWLQESMRQINPAVSFSGIPQYEYVFDEKGNQRVNHVLYYEHLEHEFNSLMQTYNMSLRYSKKSINPSKWQHRTLSIYDLSGDTLQMINKVYSQDFATFGYEMCFNFSKSICFP